MTNMHDRYLYAEALQTQTRIADMRTRLATMATYRTLAHGLTDDEAALLAEAATMIGREIIISALREWMAELGKRSSVAVSWIGKVKTTAQMAALVWMLWRPNAWVEWAGIGLLWVAAVLTLWSMLQYLNAARGDLLEQ